MTILTTSQVELTKQVMSDLDRDEGFREFAYPDPLSKLYKQFPELRNLWGTKPVVELLAGKKGYNLDDGAPWTCGFGFTKGVNPETRIPRQLAERKLEEEVLAVDSGLVKVLTWYNSASFVTKTILINMAFNMGVKGLLGFKNTLSYISEKNYTAAAANMRKSLWYQQVTNRAERLAKRMETQKI